MKPQPEEGKGSVKLSSSQIEAIEWIGENGRFFYLFNCYIKQQTLKALLRMGITQICKDQTSYMELTPLGKTYFKTKTTHPCLNNKPL